jgi:hypothetical protein
MMSDLHHGLPGARDSCLTAVPDMDKNHPVHKWEKNPKTDNYSR